MTYFYPIQPVTIVKLSNLMNKPTKKYLKSHLKAPSIIEWEALIA